MFSDIDFMNMNTGFFDNAGMDSLYTGGIFDVTIRSNPTDRSADEDWR